MQRNHQKIYSMDGRSRLRIESRGGAYVILAEALHFDDEEETFYRTETISPLRGLYAEKNLALQEIWNLPGYR